MSSTFVYADPHAYHQGVCNFLRRDGTKLRPWDNAEEMTEALVKNYNELVQDQDRVYILGDVAFGKKNTERFLSQLKGRIVLIKGNHDEEKLSLYSKYVQDIRAYKQGKGFILSHIPIHEASLGRWQFNIHGHLHADRIMKPGFKQWIEKVPRKFGRIETVEEVFKSDYSPVPDPRYRCVSVEQTDYRPVLLSKILEEKPV